MSNAVIVLGPYRSGTSLTAQILESLGVDFGPREELLAPNRFNPGGYLERGDLNAINRRLITSAGGTLGDPGDPARLICLADRSTLNGYSLPWPDAGPLWGLKDPRFCATLKLWIDAGALQADTIRIVRVHRDVDAIVRSSVEHPSVRKFCHGDEALARKMVGDYIGLADWQARTLGLPTFHLDYEELIRDPSTEITKIAAWLRQEDRRAIRRAVRLVGKRSARGRFYFRKSITLPFRAVRKAYRLAARSNVFGY